MVKSKKTAEYGDFQTPSGLAKAVCALLAREGLRPAAIVEPTCGIGSFLFAALDQFKDADQAVGVEINRSYIEHARACLRRRAHSASVEFLEADFFATDWAGLIAALPEPILVLGNLPWVTSAHLGKLGSTNRPPKSNFQDRKGLDAVTGKANFDIAEWMLIQLIEAMNGRRGSLAMLCKSSVARKTLLHGWRLGVMTERSAIYAIDAQRHFDAAVDAALLVTHFAPGLCDRQAKVFSSLHADAAQTTLGYDDGTLLADAAAYRRWKRLCGDGAAWRSGVKHDCSKVMELRREGGKYRNGLGELVQLEDECVFPMLKGSDIARRAKKRERFMVVPQRKVGEETAPIQRSAPRTWAYLTAHAELFDRRASSIYRNRPPFSIFGVGDYSFAPWKVAISGFSKKLEFVVVGPAGDRPVMLDDISYFLPCRTEEQARLAAELLNSPAARAFFGAFVFWDGKRPVTAELLRRLDLRKLAEELRKENEYDALFAAPCAGESPRKRPCKWGSGPDALWDS